MRRYRKWVMTLGLVAAAPNVGLAGPFDFFRPKTGGAPADAAHNQQVAEQVAARLRIARLRGQNDIDIKYESSKEFEAQIGSLAQAGNTPDLAIFPQPGLLADLASRGYMQPAPDGVADNVKNGWSEDWAAYGTVDGTLYGAPLMASVKGFIWYSPSLFEENGWQIPETWDDLLALTQTIADSGRVPWCVGGFFNAYLLSKGDDKYLDVWRKTADRFDAAAKTVDGKLSAPTMFGDQGFYSFKPGKYRLNFLEIYALSMKASDRARCEETDWYHFLEGRNPDYPVKALREAMARIRKQMQTVDGDTSSPDMRLADSALEYNPASIKALTQLIEGGLYLQHGSWARTSPNQGGTLLFARLRYFDPENRRAGMPQDVAALVDGWGPDSLTVTLVNLNPTLPRSVIVQGGAYAEHRIVSVSDGKTGMAVDAPSFPVRLMPGAGARLTIRMKRFANDPTLSFPWEATVADLGDIAAPPQAEHGG